MLMDFELMEHDKAEAEQRVAQLEEELTTLGVSAAKVHGAEYCVLQGACW